MKDEPEEYVYNLSPLPFLLFFHERLFPILRRGVSKSVLWSFPATIIPMTNQIENPEYWWEWILNGTVLTLALNMTIFAWMDISLIFNFKPLSIITSFIRILMIDLLTQSLFLILCHIIWTI